jgi:uncharacterized protein (DUF608 family)
MKSTQGSLGISTEGQRWFDSACTEAAFLIGGIGTGNFSIGARGELRDWEVFGRPGKGNYFPNTFFAIWVKEEGKPPVASVLEAQLSPPFSKSHGFVAHEIGGLRRFAQSRMKGEYPFVTVELSDPALPVAVSLEAFNPFIPLDADDSGLPVGLLCYRVRNSSDQPISASVAGSLCNLTTLKSYDRHTWKHYQVADEVVNEYQDDGLIRGLFYRPKTLHPFQRYYGTMALTTRSHAVTHKRAWLNGGWWDGLQDFWDDFSQDGRLEAESAYVEVDAVHSSPDQTGSLAIHHDLLPGDEQVFEFQIAWHFPNRVNSWSEGMYREARQQGKKVAPCCEDGDCESDLLMPTIRQYYAARFENAWRVSHYAASNLPRLEGDSRNFHRALFSSTLPAYVLDAVASNITVLRSPTCFRLEDGTLMAWEGCFDDEGCCEGNCTHVLNYSQTMAFLFPELERSMRRLEYKIESEANGKMNFRSYQPFGMDPHDHMPAADGQLGTFIRLYREWKLSGDDDFLRELWGAAARSLDFAFEFWDKDRDFVLDTDQFNTYDIAFQGPSSMVNSIFLAALRAGEEMAAYLGDNDRAARYRQAFEIGSRRVDELLWGGEYYLQKTDDLNRYRYQYGEGCLSDQLLGQTWAHLMGLGYILPREHVRSAIRAIFAYNFRDGFGTHANPQRTYALNDEKGLVLCSWPHGGRPRLPFPYSDEVWTGIEYHVATHLIYEGYVDEALTIVKAVRDRHDGVRRNPWNEVECGHHYMRSLASYGLLIALSGFEYDLPRGKIAFHPAIERDHFQCFFSTGKCWGIYRQRTDADGGVERDIEVLYGSLT